VFPTKREGHYSSKISNIVVIKEDVRTLRLTEWRTIFKVIKLDPIDRFTIFYNNRNSEWTELLKRN